MHEIETLCIYRSHTNDQCVDVPEAEPVATTNDNDQCDGKDCFNNSQASKRTRSDIIDEIKEEIMLFLKDQRYETDLVFVRKDHFRHLH